MFRLLLFRVCLVVGLILPAACSTIGGVAPDALQAASPLDADPGALVIKLTKPAVLPIRDGDLALSLRWAVPGRDLLEEEAGMQVVRRSAAAPDRSGQAARNTVDLVLAPEDAQRFAALIARVRTDRQAGIRGDGAFAVSFTAHCIAGGADLSDMVVDVTLTLKPGQAEIALMRGAKIGRLLARRGIERLPACRTGSDGAR